MAKSSWDEVHCKAVAASYKRALQKIAPLLSCSFGTSDYPTPQEVSSLSLTFFHHAKVFGAVLLKTLQLLDEGILNKYGTCWSESQMWYERNDMPLLLVGEEHSKDAARLRST
jgi:hypothetical protein